MKLYPMSKGLDCRFYKKNATPTPHQALRLQMIRRLARSCTGRALDYGCGYGDITYALASLFDEIEGVDIGSERVEWAQKEYTPINFTICSNEGLQYESESFDTILSVVVINWVTDPDRYLNEIHRLLRPGGKLVLAAAAPPRLRMFVRGILGQPPPSQAHWYEPLEEMTQRLKRIGFTIEMVDCFYDPLSESVHNLKDVLIQSAALPFRLIRAPEFAPYYGLRVRK